MKSMVNWKELHEALDAIYSEFNKNYSYYKSNNKKEKLKAGWRIEKLIERASSLVRENDVLMEVLTLGDNSEQKILIVMNEFADPKYFERDIIALNDHCKEKIKNES